MTESQHLGLNYVFSRSQRSVRVSVSVKDVGNERERPLFVSTQLRSVGVLLCEAFCEKTHKIYSDNMTFVTLYVYNRGDRQAV